MNSRTLHHEKQPPPAHLKAHASGMVRGLVCVLPIAAFYQGSLAWEHIRKPAVLSKIHSV